VVFETLNARGQPLLQSDLIKNHLIHAAQKQGKDPAVLHKNYWSFFEHDSKFWRKSGGRGHARKLRIEQFFFNYLSLVTLKEVSAGTLYQSFKRYAADARADIAPETEIARIANHARHYRRLIEQKDLRPAEIRLRETLDAFNFVALDPLMLGILERYGDQPEARDAIALDLESWLVRRTVCRLNTRGYNRFCLELIRFLPETDSSYSVAERIRNHLAKQTSDSTRWPDNEEFKNAWLERPIYVELTQPRVRLVLARLELAARAHSDGKSEAFDIHQHFTIEHLMPRKWEQHWPLPDGDLDRMTLARNRKIHTIGNLTLLTAKLNSSVSNSPWGSRRQEIQRHSTLRLNQDVVSQSVWSEDKIDERAERLFELASLVWPCHQNDGRTTSASPTAGQERASAESAGVPEPAASNVSTPAILSDVTPDRACSFCNAARSAVASLPCSANWKSGGGRSLTVAHQPLNEALTNRFGDGYTAQIWLEPPSGSEAVAKFEICDHLRSLSKEASKELRERLVTSIRDHLVGMRLPDGVALSTGSTALRLPISTDEPKRVAALVEFLDSALSQWLTHRFSHEF
ncbi:MAG: HNH endonuclease family protein, partial [Opitutales bacterium]